MINPVKLRQHPCTPVFFCRTFMVRPVIRIPAEVWGGQAGRPRRSQRLCTGKEPESFHLSDPPWPHFRYISFIQHALEERPVDTVSLGTFVASRSCTNFPRSNETEDIKREQHDYPEQAVCAEAEYTRVQGHRSSATAICSATAPSPSGQCWSKSLCPVSALEQVKRDIADPQSYYIGYMHRRLQLLPASEEVLRLQFRQHELRSVWFHLQHLLFRHTRPSLLQWQVQL